MRKLLFVIVAMFSLLSCKKTEESPDLALIASGSYRVTELKSNGASIIPVNTLGQRLPTTALMSVNRTATNTITVSMTVTDATGSLVVPFGSYTLQGTVDNIDINSGNTVVGIVSQKASIAFSVPTFQVMARK